MRGGRVQHRQTAAWLDGYDEGHREGRAVGFKAGEEYGRGIQRMHDELKPIAGFALGVLVSTITVIVLHALGVMP